MEEKVVKGKPRRRKKRRKRKYKYGRLKLNTICGIADILNCVMCMIQLFMLFASVPKIVTTVLPFLSVLFVVSLVLHLIGAHYTNVHKMSIYGHASGITGSALALVLPEVGGSISIIFFLFAIFKMFTKQMYLDIPKRKIPPFYKNKKVLAGFFFSALLSMFVVKDIYDAGRTETKKTTATTATVSSSAEEDGEGTEDKASATIAFGKKYKGERFEITVKDLVEETTLSDDNWSGYEAGEDMKYAMVEVNIKNISKEAQSFDFTHFRISTGDTEEMYYYPSVLSIEKAIDFETLDPGATKEGYLIYEVDEKFKPESKVLRYSGNAGSGSEEIDFKLK